MKKGFTVFEILVVLGIIVLISLVSLPLLSNYQKSSKLKNEARALATNLRLAQQLAITEQNIYNLQLLKDDGEYKIINSATSSTTKEIILDTEIRISQIDSLTNDTAQFNPTGAAIETGFIYLVNTKNETSTIEIKPSGYVQLTE